MYREVNSYNIFSLLTAYQQASMHSVFMIYIYIYSFCVLIEFTTSTIQTPASLSAKSDVFDTSAIATNHEAVHATVRLCLTLCQFVVILTCFANNICRQHCSYNGGCVCNIRVLFLLCIRA